MRYIRVNAPVSCLSRGGARLLGHGFQGGFFLCGAAFLRTVGVVASRYILPAEDTCSPDVMYEVSVRQGASARLRCRRRRPMTKRPDRDAIYVKRQRSSSFAKRFAAIGRLGSARLMRTGQRIAPCGCFGANIRLGAGPWCALANISTISWSKTIGGSSRAAARCLAFSCSTMRRPRLQGSSSFGESRWASSSSASLQRTARPFHKSGPRFSPCKATGCTLHDNLTAAFLICTRAAQ
jgi:hypothetical protein